VCEVCGEEVVDVRKLPTDIRDKIYKPKESDPSIIELKFDEHGNEISPHLEQPETIQVDVELDE
jgi:hypothetical protein